jgi:hypothetical protein
MTSNDPAPPAWLSEYVATRKHVLEERPMDLYVRGQVSGVLDAAVLRGDLARADADQLFSAAVPSLTTVHHRATVSETLTATSGRAVNATRPVPPAQRKVEPDRAIAVDGFLGEFLGNPVRLVGIGLFPEEVHVALSMIATPAMWAMEREWTTWREDPREGTPGAGMTFGRYFMLTDDAGTRYTIGGSSGGNGWAMHYVAKFRPGVPAHATAVLVSLLDDNGIRMNTLSVDL